MLSDNKITEEDYAELQEIIKKQRLEYMLLRNCKEYKVGSIVCKTISYLKKFQFKKLVIQYKKWRLSNKNKKFNTITEVAQYVQSDTNNYFSKHRIAVYTVIFGSYDKLQEPLVKPNNIDYYIITDQNFNLENSVWNKLEIDDHFDTIRGFNNIEKNRYFKIMPSKIFKDYEYSIYVDGNIQILTDLTEYISKVNSCGIATHYHFSRDCAYDEMEAILFNRRDTVENIKRHRNLLLKSGLPKNYGLAECNFLVRHHTDYCNKLMELWWNEFMNYSKRDQISFIHTVFTENISLSSVATLGLGTRNNPSFRIVEHS